MKRRIRSSRAERAAKVILEGVKAGNTRILIGEDARVIDVLVRLFPRLVYNDSFLATVLLPWMVLANQCAKVGLPFGRFAYPILVSGLGALGYKGLTSRM